MKHLSMVLVILLTAIPQFLLAVEGPHHILYQGRIIKADGSALEGNTDFTVELMGSSCILYRETFLNVYVDKGFFSLALGSGTTDMSLPISTLRNAITNSNGTLSGQTSAAAPCSFVPDSGDGRKVKLTYTHGTLKAHVSFDLQNVPYAQIADTANNALKLEGLKKKDFVQVNEAQGVTQSKLEEVFAPGNFDQLKALLNGTSSLYAGGSTFTPSANVSMNGQRIENIADPVNPTDAVNKSWIETQILNEGVTDANISPGAGISRGKMASGTPGRVLVNNASGAIADSNVTDTELGFLSGVTSALQAQLNTLVSAVSAKVSKAGDTLSGHLTLANEKEVRFQENSVNGTNYVALKAPESLASDVTFTLPFWKGSSGSVLVSDGNGNLNWSTTVPTSISFGKILVGGILNDASEVSVGGDASLAVNGNLTIQSVGGESAANIASGAGLANAATSANVGNSIVKRDPSGNFTAGTITANLNGNANTATTATNFSGSLVGDVTGSQGATVVGKIQGRTVSGAAPSTGQVMQWNGTAWAPATAPGSGTSCGSYPHGRVYTRSNGGNTILVQCWNGTAIDIADITPYSIPPAGTCFVAGTKVLKENLEWASIETIQVGDRVVGIDGHINTVRALWRPQIGDRKLYHINNELHMTGDHMMWTPEGRWAVLDLSLYTARRYNRLVYASGEDGVSVPVLLSGIAPEFVGTLRQGDLVQSLYGPKELKVVSSSTESPDLQLYTLVTDGNASFTVEGGYYVDGVPQK